MSEEIKLAEANVRSIIELRRRAEQAESDAAAMRRALDVLTRVGDVESARSVARAMLRRVDAGAALLAELEAAREALKTIDEAWHAAKTDRAFRRAYVQIRTALKARSE